MPQIIGYNFSVVVDGRKLPEYNTTVDESKGFPVVTCWVPSEAGKTFHIDIAAPPAPRRSNTVFKLLLDGRRPSVRGNLLKKTNTTKEFMLCEEKVTATTARSFQFGTLQLTDDETLLSTDTQALGNIHVKVDSVENLEPKPKKQDGFGRGQITSQIHERSKKAMVHCIQGGEERIVSKAGNRHTAIDQQRIAEVIFKYRSLDVLIADGIAPQSSSRPALVSRLCHTNEAAGPSNSRKRKASASSSTMTLPLVEDRKRLKVADEVKALKARLAALEAEIHDGAAVKQEVKSETRPTFIPGEVIDLTLD
ncbi:hypothetical protein BKA70DRAFT_1263033 [Coprinopsis sp. MPI-PUGE-AT-0042]|nr:hypothetical protein BKA70DRAFT_1263033 [Coprinopsis sp. MPI-PUGE-AT-0042]